MIYAATEGNYVLIVQPDDEPVNPREDYDPFGHMVCWHRRYWLGDQHDYNGPEEFLRSLCRKPVRDDMSIDDLKALLAEQSDLVILPLYLYDHSGLSISTGSFIGRAVHAEWDSGQVGYIYATREDIVNNYGDASPESVEKAKALLEAEVQSYDWYLRGECYGYRLYQNGQELDACWGFLGDFDDVKEDIASCLPDVCEALLDKLEPYYGSAEEYLYDVKIA